MNKNRRELFESELARMSKKVADYIYENARRHGEELRKTFKPIDIAESVYYYTRLGGKRLRPAVLLASCGAVGGDENAALPAAAAVEIYHTWTLIHDDIIDKDTKRRHGDTVHIKWSQKARTQYRWLPEQASHYGLTVAILAGDVQQGWAVASLLPDLYWRKSVDAEVALKLVHELDFETLRILVEGETLDVIYSTRRIDDLDQEKILEMLWKKTGVLYRFCGMAGAMIGLNTSDKENSEVVALSEFASRCGIAFQLQDDVLGIYGDEEKLGKPVGSDIREGKRTIPLWKTYMAADPGQRQLIGRVVGNPTASPREIQSVTELFKDLGGLKYTQELARAYIEGGNVGGTTTEGALSYLKNLDDSRYKSFLRLWADYMISREF
ncbi:MAG: polyprenyl synthetase family protein [Candidatus Bathyarchaeota archaeon]|nr:polyprenyl synthetase family protein [Candidatus Bathyarchaeota archaeon]